MALKKCNKRRMSVAEPLEARRLLVSTYNLSTLASFFPFPQGSSPDSTLVSDGRGNLYGTTSDGGIYGTGTVFKIAAGTSSLSTLLSYPASSAPGINTSSLAVNPKGTVYGTTFANNVGTVFEIAPGTSSLTSVATFDDSNGEFYAPIVLDTAGNLYGTSSGGGTNNAGMVYEIRSGTSSITTIASFGGLSGGAEGIALLPDASGDLYGVNEFSGGSSEDGDVFEIASGSSSITVLASFNGTNGKYPALGLVRDPAGDLYGSTVNGGVSNDGTIFELSSGSSSITVISSFNGTNGTDPNAVSIDAQGNLFGTTEFGGGANSGTLFELKTGSTSISVLSSFDGNTGGNPEAGVLLDANGNLYGSSTGGGGPEYSGSIFKLTSGAASVSLLYSFTSVQGADPGGTVTLDASGNLYGTTLSDGVDSYDGTIFKIASASSSITTLTNFPSVLLQTANVSSDATGNFYAISSLNTGSIYKIAAGSGSVTTVASFAYSSGIKPAVAPTVDARGDLFGTTTNGGLNNDGMIYEIGLGTSSITTLASFTAATGAAGGAGLTLDSNGDIFGVAPHGGTLGVGIIFELASGASSITTLAAFNGSNGDNPNFALLRDASGNLFGATTAGGLNSEGTLFELASGSSSIADLANFDGYTKTPATTPIMDASGNLYGVTRTGGANQDGSVYELPSGSRSITTIFSFNAATGTNPASGLAIDASGGLYGATEYGGTAQAGTVYKLTPTAVTAPDVKSFKVDDGTTQRSAVRSLTISFTVPVSVDAGAVSLLKVANGISTVVSFHMTLSNNNTTLLITPTSTSNGGSLSDGNYSLVIHPTGVHPLSNPATSISGADQTYTFFRLFGDSNGDGTVNLIDYRAFTSTYLKSSGATGYNSAFDSNGDGTINLLDYRAFTANYLRTLTS